jgi:hypothetical protein
MEHDDDIVSGDIEDALPEAEEDIDEENPEIDLEAKKKKDLIDDDNTVSLEDEAEEELDAEDEPYDDITNY